MKQRKSVVVPPFQHESNRISVHADKVLVSQLLFFHGSGVLVFGSNGVYLAEVEQNEEVHKQPLEL